VSSICNSVGSLFDFCDGLGALTVMPASAQTFNDVPPQYFAAPAIEEFAARGITRGCDEGLFCPEDAVTRGQMAVFLERGIRGGDYEPPPATGTLFNDVAAGYFAARYIEVLAADEITSGCDVSLYCPEDPVTRAQMAIFLLKAKFGSDYVPPTASGTEFLDVSNATFGADWIEKLAAEGITVGCGDGTNFCPADPVTRAQMAVFFVRAFPEENPTVVPMLELLLLDE